MSGIVGLINQAGQPVERELLGRLTAFLAFRGPDDQRVWVEGRAGLGHTMLRTTFESESEQQPCSLDGQVWITADARLDGRAELIKQLAARGCANLKNIPDVELILQAYQVWGDDCLQHLSGDFALAIWDGPRRRLLAARDHMGVKPFYYAEAGRSLVFSNTLNCIRQHPDISDRLNDLAIADFLLYDFNQDPATTTFADIQRLPAAHYLTWQPGGAVKVRRYWNLPQEEPIRYRRQRDYVDHFQELLWQAVADRLRTDKVGVFMSGGLDSTTLTAAAKDLLAARSTPYDLRAYTMAYDRLIPYEEGHYSSLVAAHLNIPHHYLMGDDYRPYDRADLPELSTPEPKNDSDAASFDDFLRLAAAHSKVIFTGEGGDPVLYPSSRYVHDQVRNLRWGRLLVDLGHCALAYRRLPQIGLRSAIQRWRDPESSVEPFPVWLDQSFAARYRLRERWDLMENRSMPSHPCRRELCKILTNPMWQNLFENTFDPGATGLPLEFRHPFFDFRLVSFALRLPPIPWCVDKVLLREAIKGVLPEEVRTRPKTIVPGDPIKDLLHRPENDSRVSFTPHPRLLPYVNWAAIPPAREVEDYYKIRMNLRPISLNYWLRQAISSEYAGCQRNHTPKFIDLRSSI